MSEIIKSLEWRYATKKFDPSKKVSATDLEEIKRSLQLTASSFGLQAYKIAVIENKELQAKLRPASWDQPQISDASHIILFCSKTDLPETYIDRHIDLHRTVRKTPEDRLDRYRAYLSGYLDQKTPEQIQEWSARQTYIAMGNLLTVLALKRIDACPIEGIEPDKWDDILDLSKDGLHSVACVAVGYRADDDPYQNEEKIRLSQDDLFITY